MDNSGKRAIVIGASLAGLLAARVLSDHFSRVILIERDKFPPPGENRKGVPQGKHTHVLLELGRQIMESYLPGLTDELIDLGAEKVRDASLNVMWFQNDGYLKSGPSGIGGIGVSRPTIEATVRKHVLSYHNITVFEECSVKDLTASKDRSTITGIKFSNAGKDKTIMADLVVDASGRGSQSRKWLEKLGYIAPEEEKVKIGIGYTTCFFPRKPNHIPGKAGIVFLTNPPDKRLGVMLAQDGNRWVVTLGGYLGDHVPANHKDFLAAAEHLPAPELYNVIKDATPLGDPVTYKFQANQRHHFESLSRFPDGFLVFGDAICSFNPIYGQGMTVASMEARILDDCLKHGYSNLARIFFKKAGKVIDLSWDTATGGDLNYPEVEGKRTLLIRFLNWYISKLHMAAHYDARVSIAFLKVINMVSPPPSILHPEIVWRVLKHNLINTQRKISRQTDGLKKLSDQVESFS